MAGSMWLGFKTVPYRLEVLRIETCVKICLRSALQRFVVEVAAEAIIVQSRILHEMKSEVCKRPVLDAKIRTGAIAPKASVCVPESATGNGPNIACFVPVRLAAGVSTLALQEILMGSHIHAMPWKECTLVCVANC